MDRNDRTEHSDETFTGADFTGQSSAGHTYENCVFRGCDLKQAKFENARFIECTFTTCDLSNLAMPGARFRDVTFENSKLIGIQWPKLADLVNPTFRECNLGYGSFAGMKLKKTVFTKSVLRECEFAQAELSECDFRDCDFLGARFANTTLTKADFRGAVSYLVDPISNRVRGARFSHPESQGLLSGLGVIID